MFSQLSSIKNNQPKNQNLRNPLAKEIDNEMRKKYEEFFGINSRDYSHSLFTSQQQIDRYAKNLSFWEFELYKIADKYKLPRKASIILQFSPFGVITEKDIIRLKLIEISITELNIKINKNIDKNKIFSLSKIYLGELLSSSKLNEKNSEIETIKQEESKQKTEEEIETIKQEENKKVSGTEIKPKRKSIKNNRYTKKAARKLRKGVSDEDIINKNYKLIHDRLFKEGIINCCLLSSVILFKKLKSKGINCEIVDGFNVYDNSYAIRHVWVELENGKKLDIGYDVAIKHNPLLKNNIVLHVKEINDEIKISLDDQDDYEFENLINLVKTGNFEYYEKGMEEFHEIKNIYRNLIDQK